MIKFEDLIKPLTLKEFRSKYDRNRPFYSEPGISENYGKKKKIVTGLVSWFRLNYLFNAQSGTEELYDSYMGGEPIVIDDADTVTVQIQECLKLFEGFFDKRCESTLHLYPQNFDSPVCVPVCENSVFMVVSGTSVFSVYPTSYDMLKKDSLTQQEEDELIPAIEQSCNIGSLVYVPHGLYYKIEPQTNSFILQIRIKDEEPQERKYFDFYRNWKK